MTEGAEKVGEDRGSEPGPLWLWSVRFGGVVCFIAGLGLLGRLDRTGVTGGILLLVAALGLLAAGLGRPVYGPETEGPLDLSTRLAVGLLGGALGGLAYLAAAWAGGTVGIPELFGSGWQARLGPDRWGAAALAGAVWGVLFGLVVRRLPGRDPVTQGLLFSLLPVLWTGLVVFPGLQYGAFGARLGALTMVPVVLYHLAWGLVVGSVLRWARDTGYGPLSRPLGA